MAEPSMPFLKKQPNAKRTWKLNDKAQQGIFETGDHNCAQRESANLKIDNNSPYLIGTTQYSFYLACNDSKSKNTGKQQQIYSEILQPHDCESLHYLHSACPVDISEWE